MVVVDSNKHAIEIDSPYDELRKRAESANELYHYCGLDALKEIINTGGLLFNCLYNFNGKGEYERKGLDENYQRTIFIACMTRSKNSKKMWKYKGNNGKGVKLVFHNDTAAIHDTIFDKTKMVDAYSSDGTKLYEFGFNISSFSKHQLTCDPNIFTDVIVDVSITDVVYSDLIKDSNIIIENDNHLNLSTMSKTVVNKFQDQEETRCVAALRSAHEMQLCDIDHLIVPLSFVQPRLSIEFGNRVSDAEKKEIDFLLEQKYL